MNFSISILQKYIHYLKLSLARTKEILETKEKEDVKTTEQITALEKTIEQLRIELNNQQDNERLTQLEQENTRLEEQIKKQVSGGQMKMRKYNITFTNNTFI